MFNGIIYNQGKVKKIKNSQKGKSIFISSKIHLNKRNIGMSVSCDGVCLTLVSYKNKILEFYLLDETIKRSKFKFLKIGDYINLELPLKYGQDISGHICQGHVDTTSKIYRISKKGSSRILEFKVDKKYISVEDTIKSLGNYSAIVDFGDDISAKVKLKVVAE